MQWAFVSGDNLIPLYQRIGVDLGSPFVFVDNLLDVSYWALKHFLPSLSLFYDKGLYLMDYISFCISSWRLW